MLDRLFSLLSLLKERLCNHYTALWVLFVYWEQPSRAQCFVEQQSLLASQLWHTHMHAHRTEISDSQTLAVSCGQGEGFKSSEHSTWTCWTCLLHLLLAIVLPSTFSKCITFSKSSYLHTTIWTQLKDTPRKPAHSRKWSLPCVKISYMHLACSWERHKPGLIMMGDVTQ